MKKRWESWRAVQTRKKGRDRTSTVIQWIPTICSPGLRQCLYQSDVFLVVLWPFSLIIILCILPSIIFLESPEIFLAEISMSWYVFTNYNVACREWRRWVLSGGCLFYRNQLGVQLRKRSRQIQGTRHSLFFPMIQSPVGSLRPPPFHHIALCWCRFHDNHPSLWAKKRPTGHSASANTVQELRDPQRG